MPTFNGIATATQEITRLIFEHLKANFFILKKISDNNKQADTFVVAKLTCPCNSCAPFPSEVKTTVSNYILVPPLCDFMFVPGIVSKTSPAPQNKVLGPEAYRSDIEISSHGNQHGLLSVAT